MGRHKWYSWPTIDHREKPKTLETPTDHIYAEIESAAVMFRSQAAAHAGNNQLLNFNTGNRVERGYYDPHK